MPRPAMNQIEWIASAVVSVALVAFLVIGCGQSVSAADKAKLDAATTWVKYDVPCAKEADASLALDGRKMSYEGDECFPSSRAFCDCVVHSSQYAAPISSGASQFYEDCLMRSTVECHNAELSKLLK
jgi:hypothetical protein